MNSVLGGWEPEMKNDAEGLLCPGTVLGTFTFAPSYSLKPPQGIAVVPLWATLLPKCKEKEA